MYREEYIYQNDMLVDKYSLFSHNIFNCVLTLILALLLYKITSLYISSTVIKILFVLSVLYCAFTWNYLRAQSYEVVHLVLFSGFYYYFICFLRLLPPSRSFRSVPGFMPYNIFLALLCLSKS